MTPLLLATKLNPPQVTTEMVRRPRLLARLNAALTCKAILVSAPAGSGKTTLATEWLQTYPNATGWVSLDATDNEPVTFLRYFLAAIQSIHTEMGGIASHLLDATPTPSVLSVLAPLINDLTKLPSRLILVLDDYHLIISVATVKRHVYNIYGKLGVNHRAQAIARAHELVLL